MRKIVIPLNAFNSKEVLEKGQGFFVPMISRAGANGIEIRRELLTKHDYPLTQLKTIIIDSCLFLVYSAPNPLWKADGVLNSEELNSVIQEAKELGASLIKVPLGHYEPSYSNIRDMEQLLKESETNIKLLVENDQTPYGGTIHPLSCFFQNVHKNKLSIHMTFDIGNWKYCGENVVEALRQLYPFIRYIHLKHVERHGESWETLPLPMEKSAEWKGILAALPQDLPVALEFPIENVQLIQRYIRILQAS